jgi:ComF family protein
LFTQCRSALAYHDEARRFILKFKQGDGTYLAPGLSRLMVRAGQDILSQTDLLVPVPLHWKRLFLRQYNQATLLSHYITHQTCIPTRTDLLKRHRSTRKQGHQNRKERSANVRGAFIIPLGKAPVLKGKRLTLIDDVFTTGATLSECARILLNAGAKEVRALTLARVIMPQKLASSLY